MADKDSKFGANERLRVFLNDSVTAAKNPFDIIIEIAEILGDMAKEKTYARTVRAQIISTYGLALRDNFVLDKELAEVTARLEKISAAYNNPDFDDDEHQRIGFALERHKKEIERLTAMKNA